MKKILFSLILVYLCSCGDNYESVSPGIGKITESVYASGYVKSKNQYQVFSKVSGTIEKIWQREGDLVKAGQPLFTLSNEVSKLTADNALLAANNASMSENQDRLKELSLSIEVARKKMESDLLLLQRQRNLWEQQIGTKLEKEQRELAYENSKASHESVQLRYQELKKQLNLQAAQSKNNLSISHQQLSDYIIKSEINGKLYSVNKEKGELVSPQSALALIGSDHEFYLKLEVDENDIVKIKTGQKVFVNMDSYKGNVYEATITKINPLMNEKSRTFEIEAVFTKKPEVLYPQLTVEANIEIQTKEKALIIPRKYLIDDSFVMISKKEKRQVKTGLKDYDNVEIIEGLKVSDKIYIKAP